MRAPTVLITVFFLHGCAEQVPDLALGTLERLLQDDFEVHTAFTGHEALAVCGEHGPFAVVVTDLKMPRMSGAELYLRGRELHPGLGFVLCSGDLSEWSDAGHAGDPGAVCLEKPFDAAALDRALGKVLGRGR